MQHVHGSSLRRPVVTGMGLGQTLAIFGAGSALLFVGTHGLIPMLSRLTGQEPILFWFLIGGLGVFVPLLLLAVVLLHTEGTSFDRRLWTERLRFRAMNGGDWLWSLGAMLLIGALSTGLATGRGMLLGHVDQQPPFMRFEPLTPERVWLLALWLPFWVLNIMGEEILWRGVLLPRQEQTFGRWAWLVNSGGWLLFHLAFGWQLLILLLPILVIMPYVVQRRGNSWVGVLIHAGLNGAGFLAIAFGFI